MAGGIHNLSDNDLAAVFNAMLATVSVGTVDTSKRLQHMVRHSDAAEPGSAVPARSPVTVGF